MFPPGMEEAMQQMFGKIVKDAVEEALKPHTELIARMTGQIEQVNAVIETAKAKGGFVAKQFLGS